MRLIQCRRQGSADLPSHSGLSRTMNPAHSAAEMRCRGHIGVDRPGERRHQARGRDEQRVRGLRRRAYRLGCRARRHLGWCACGRRHRREPALNVSRNLNAIFVVLPSRSNFLLLRAGAHSHSSSRIGVDILHALRRDRSGAAAPAVGPRQPPDPGGVPRPLGGGDGLTGAPLDGGPGTAADGLDVKETQPAGG
jgi:hypothetical protein